MSDHSFDVADAIKYGVEPAIIIKNLRFWLAKNVANVRHQYDGYYWTYNSAKAFAELFPYWTSNKLQKLLKRMEDDGIILSGVYNERGYDRTKWYTLPEFSVTLIENARHAIQPNGGMEKAKRLNGKSQTAEPIPDVNPDRKPDESSSSVESGESGDNEDKATVEWVIAAYAKILPELPQVVKITDARRSAIRARIKDHEVHRTKEFWISFFSSVRESDWLMRANNGAPQQWLGIDWLIGPKNFYKVVEGNYANRI